MRNACSCTSAIASMSNLKHGTQWFKIHISRAENLVLVLVFYPTATLIPRYASLRRINLYSWGQQFFPHSNLQVSFSFSAMPISILISFMFVYAMRVHPCQSAYILIVES
jgi:hypothetical protein